MSAGADPGPACFRHGGTSATVTDAHVALGRLPTDRAIGGLGSLGLAEARAAVSRVADAVGLETEAAALGILEIADAAMERAIRVMTVQRGIDPRDFALVAFGGAGPLHAVSIAQRMGIRRVLVPAVAGVLSAFGLAASPVGRDLSRSLVRPLAHLDVDELNGIVRELVRRGRTELEAEGVPDGEIRATLEADLRYVGQSHELTVPLGTWDETAVVDAAGLARMATSFHETHRRQYGHDRPEEGLEFVTVRARVAGASPEPAAPSWEPSAPNVHTGLRDVWFDREGATPTQAIDRATIGTSTELKGPALVVSVDATLVVPPGTTGHVDAQGTIQLEIG